jgi:hypothetical protein
MAAGGLSEADIAAVQGHLAMLRVNELVPTKPHILERLIEEEKAHPSAGAMMADPSDQRLSTTGVGA